MGSPSHYIRRTCLPDKKWLLSRKSFQVFGLGRVSLWRVRREPPPPPLPTAEPAHAEHTERGREGRKFENPPTTGLRTVVPADHRRISFTLGRLGRVCFFFFAEAKQKHRIFCPKDIVLCILSALPSHFFPWSYPVSAGSMAGSGFSGTSRSFPYKEA